jgi:hypothetical protein
MHEASRPSSPVSEGQPERNLGIHAEAFTPGLEITRLESPMTKAGTYA